MRFSKLCLKAILAAVVAVVVIACGGAVAAYIGGTVTGLASGNKVGLTLAINGASVETLSVAFNSSDNKFSFGSTVASGESYSVTVSTQPSGQTCLIRNGSGKISDTGGDVTNVEVVCQIGTGSTVPLTASVAGLAQGAQLVLQDVAAGTLTVTGTAGTAAGGTLTQTFPTQLTLGAIYNIMIKTQPASGPTCIITGTSGTGTITGSSSGTPSIPSPAVIVCQ